MLYAFGTTLTARLSFQGRVLIVTRPKGVTDSKEHRGNQLTSRLTHDPSQGTTRIRIGIANSVIAVG